MLKKWILTLIILLCFIPGSDAFVSLASNSEETTAADDLSNADELLREFVEDNLPEGDYRLLVQLDRLLEYQQFSNLEITGTALGDVVKTLGMDADIYVFAKTGSYQTEYHLVVDIRFSADAQITDLDTIEVGYLQFAGSDAENATCSLWSKNPSFGQWRHTADLTVYSSDPNRDRQSIGSGQRLYLSGGDFQQNGKERRVLLCVNDLKTLVSSNYSPISPDTSIFVEWTQDTDRLAAMEQSAFPWDRVVTVLVILTEAVVIVLLILRLRKLRRQGQGVVGLQAVSPLTPRPSSTEPFQTESSRLETELQKTLNLNSEDVSYLRSIGYFDSDKEDNE